MIAGLLPAVLDDLSEQPVADTLLEHADLAARFGAPTDRLAALREAAAPTTRRAETSDLRLAAGSAQCQLASLLDRTTGTTAL